MSWKQFREEIFSLGDFRFLEEILKTEVPKIQQWKYILGN